MAAPLTPAPALFGGIDFSKVTLDAAVRPSGEAWQATNDPDGTTPHRPKQRAGARAGRLKRPAATRPPAPLRSLRSAPGRRREPAPGPRQQPVRYYVGRLTEGVEMY